MIRGKEVSFSGDSEPFVDIEQSTPMSVQLQSGRNLKTHVDKVPEGTQIIHLALALIPTLYGIWRMD